MAFVIQVGDKVVRKYREKPQRKRLRLKANQEGGLQDREASGGDSKSEEAQMSEYLRQFGDQWKNFVEGELKDSLERNNKKLEDYE